MLIKDSISSDDERSYLIGISSEVDYFKNISNENHNRLLHSKVQVNTLEQSLNQATTDISSSEFHQSILDNLDSRRKKHCLVYILIILQLIFLVILLSYLI